MCRSRVVIVPGNESPVAEHLVRPFELLESRLQGFLLKSPLGFPPFDSVEFALNRSHDGSDFLKR